SETMDDDDFETMCEALSALTRRGVPYVIIHDARRAVRPTPTQRRLAAEQLHRDQAVSRKWLKAVALVVSSPAMAGVATAVNWITPAPFPQKFFSKFKDAEAWVL